MMILNSCYSYRKVTIPKVGDTVSIGGIDYLVVHIDEANKHMYFAKKYEKFSERTEFGSDTTYNGSIIHGKCKTYYDEKIPESIKPLLVTLECGYGCPVFIPTLAQVASTIKGSDGYYRGSGEWNYFATDKAREFKNESGAVYGWWIQTPWPDTPHIHVCKVMQDGDVEAGRINTIIGFRPCFCADISAIISYPQLEIWRTIL